MDDVIPERNITSGSNQTLTCTFYSNPPLKSITWYDGQDDQGELIYKDELEPRPGDKYTSTLFMKEIMHKTTITCVATGMSRNAKKTREISNMPSGNKFTFYIYITNEGMSII